MTITNRSYNHAIERSDGYIVVKPVLGRNGLTTTLTKVGPEAVKEKLVRFQKRNGSVTDSETCRDLRSILRWYGYDKDHLDALDERRLLNLFHESFAGLYGPSLGKNIEIQKYEDAKERAQRNLGESKNVVWRVD